MPQLQEALWQPRVEISAVCAGKFVEFYWPLPDSHSTRGMAAGKAGRGVA